MICDYCAYYTWDENDETYYCDVEMDEDDIWRLESTQYKNCPYYRDSDEYKVVKHQI